MKNNRFENNYYENNRYENYSDNNAYRRAAVKKKQSRAPLALAIISLVLVSLLLASTVWLICVQINHRDKAQPAAVTATLSQNNVLPKSATPAAEKTAESGQTAQPAADKNAEVKQIAQPADKNAEVKQTATQPAEQKSGDSPAMAVAKKAYAGHNLAYTDAANIILVDGERVYMDTKRIAPEHTGTPLHIYANGKTSYGFDWRITTDNKNYVITCNYNFDRQQYDFIIYGTEKGVSNTTIFYNTADNVQAPMAVTLNVDSSLNVTK